MSEVRDASSTSLSGSLRVKLERGDKGTPVLLEDGTVNWDSLLDQMPIPWSDLRGKKIKARPKAGLKMEDKGMETWS